MKRFLAYLLFTAMLLATLVACNGSTEESSVNSSTDISETVNDEYKDAEGNYVPKHTVKDMQNRTFTIIVKGPSHATYASDDFESNSGMYGELIEEAVTKRNDTVEKLYNVQLNVISSDDINQDILLDCQSNLGTYDAIMPNLSYLSTLASQEYLYELTSIDTFDINAPWYDKNCTEAFSIGNKVYFTTGDLTILNKVNTPSVLFNKEMAKKYYPDIDFYQLVRDGKWDFDTLVQCAKDVAVIATSDGSYSDDNQYGMVTAYGDPIRLYIGSGERICEKDADDLPYISLGSNERSITVSQKILSTMASANWLIYAEKCEAPIWETSFAIFYEGRALFRPGVFSATTKLRSLSEIEFGVLPIPKMDSTQDSYYSYCGTGSTAGIGIPICAKDPEFSAYMIEAYSAWAKNFVTPAYYEVNLRYKDLRDDESEEMLDIIFGNMVYDIGACFNFGSLSSMFSELAKAGTSDVTSYIEARRDQAQFDIEDILGVYGD